MTTPTTCSVYSSWKWAERTIRAINWPVSDDYRDTPAVWFGDVDQPNGDIDNGEPGQAAERVIVVSMVTGEQQEWSSGGTGQYQRDETYQLPIYFCTMIPGKTASQVRDRLEEMTSLVELAMRTAMATKRTGKSTWPIEFQQYITWGVEIVGMEIQITPGAEGYEGKAEMALRCTIRIGAPAQ